MNEATQSPPLPDRPSIDPRSPYYVTTVFEHGIGIRLNDKARFDVEEYCISEAWVKVPAGKTLDRKGHPLVSKLKGKVDASYRQAAFVRPAWPTLTTETVAGRYFRAGSYLMLGCPCVRDRPTASGRLGALASPSRRTPMGRLETVMPINSPPDSQYPN